MTINHQVLIDSLPQGKLRADNFRLHEGVVPTAGDDQVVVKTHAFAITAGTRAGLQGSASYAGAPKTGVVMNGTGIGEITQSNAERFPVGTVVMAPTGWQEYSVHDAAAITQVSTPSVAMEYLGPLGVNGLTAYFGVIEVGRVQRDETVLVSAAAGSVGHLAGQIARIKGARVVGVCGSAEKGEVLVEQLGFDAWVNYKDPNFREHLKLATPAGVDVYFDNTGGTVLGAALFRMNVGGRIACCGVVSQYDTDSPEPGPKGVPGLLINKRLEMRGFLLFDYVERYPKARGEINAWLHSGQMKVLTDEVNGLTAAPDAFVDLLNGGNVGTRIVRLDL